MISREVARLIAEWHNSGQTGQVTLHFKDGVILKVDSTTSIRIQRETHSEPRQQVAGGSGGKFPNHP